MAQTLVGPTGVLTEIVQKLSNNELEELYRSTDEFGQYMIASARAFARPRVIRRRIEAGKYDYTNINEEVYETCSIDEVVPLDQTERVKSPWRYASWILKNMYPLERFAPLLTLLELGEKEPELQRHVRITTMWQCPKGKIWSATLLEDSGQRKLWIRNGPQMCGWGGGPGEILLLRKVV